LTAADGARFPPAVEGAGAPTATGPPTATAVAGLLCGTGRAPRRACVFFHERNMVRLWSCVGRISVREFFDGGFH
jgi:hypothetical protein